MPSKNSRSSERGRVCWGGGAYGETEEGACPAGCPHWNICLRGWNRCGGEGGEREGHAGSPGSLPARGGENSQKPPQILVKSFAVWRSDAPP